MNFLPLPSDDAPLLIVEDDSDDLFVLRYALKKADPGRPVEVVTDGQAAIEYFDQCIQLSDTKPLPALVLLDIRMPRISGLEFLAWRKERPALTHVPIVMLTSSPERTEIEKAHELGALTYLIKPAQAGDIRALLQVVAGHSPVAELPGIKSSRVAS